MSNWGWKPQAGVAAPVAHPHQGLLTLPTLAALAFVLLGKVAAFPPPETVQDEGSLWGQGKDQGTQSVTGWFRVSDRRGPPCSGDGDGVAGVCVFVCVCLHVVCT